MIGFFFIYLYQNKELQSSFIKTVRVANRLVTWRPDAPLFEQDLWNLFKVSFEVIIKFKPEALILLYFSFLDMVIILHIYFLAI